MEIQSNSYIAKNLKTSSSDILYKLKPLKPNYKRSAYVYVLIEHQSEADKSMPLRIIEYQIAILPRHLDNNPKDVENLPLVMPLVFYNGKISPYPYNLDVDYLFNDQVLYGQHAKLGKFKIIDLTILENDEILTHGKISLLETVTRHIYQRDFINSADIIIKALKAAYEDGIKSSLVGGTFSYLGYAKEEAELEYLFRRVEQELTYYKDEVMTYAEALKSKAKQDGILQGMRKGELKAQKQIAQQLLKSGVDRSIVANATHLTMEQIEELKKTL